MKTLKADTGIFFAICTIALFVGLLIFLGHTPSVKTKFESMGRINESLGNGTENYELKDKKETIDGCEYQYKRISLTRSSLQIINSSTLIMRAKEEITIDKDSVIDISKGNNERTDGTGLDYQYGGGGGSFAGTGGSGSCIDKAISQTTYRADASVEYGKTGGRKTDTVTEISAGGGYLLLVAPKIRIDGKIISNGDDGDELTGGGSGGKIVIVSDHITINGSISANGGNGGDGKLQGSGGGGGGLILLNSNYYGKGKLTVEGGLGGKAMDIYTGCHGDNGKPGKIFVAK